MNPIIHYSAFPNRARSSTRLYAQFQDPCGQWWWLSEDTDVRPDDPLWSQRLLAFRKTAERLLPNARAHQYTVGPNGLCGYEEPR